MLLTGGHRAVTQARRLVAEVLDAASLQELIPDAELVTCELVTNAMLHTAGPAHLTLVVEAPNVRIEVRDPSRAVPMRALVSGDAMTGRGLRLLDVLSLSWGVDQEVGGKVVWAELKLGQASGADSLTDEQLLGLWNEDDDGEFAEPRVHVYLGDVPTSLLLQAKAHVDNLVREFTLAAAGALSGETSVVPTHLAQLIERVVNRFGEARMSIKHQALAAAARGEDRTRLELHLPRSAAQTGADYLRALDEVDNYARAARLLTLETLPQHRVFRRWYVEELTRQLAGEGDSRPMTFEARLLQEIGRVALAQRSSDRAARLFRVTAALSSALTPEAVAEAVLTVGVQALGAFGGGLLLASADDVMTIPGSVSYDDAAVEHVRSESRETELPAALVLRTGEPIWIESRDERDRRFPELATLERGTNALCAVPVETDSARLGALRFSFTEPRLFDDDERTFVLALAAQTAQALDRAQLYQQRADIAMALQSALLPPSLPHVDGVHLAVMYQPARETLMVGGDFYDVWRAGDGTVTFVVGDVCGTGARAAATTATVRHTLHALTTTQSDPAPILDKMNQALYADLLGPHDPEMFLTATLGVLRPGKKGLAVEVATGGHPWPLLRRADGSVEEVEVTGSFLGALPEVEIGVRTVTLQKGDTLLLYTDGITEARGVDGGMFGLESLVAAVSASPGDPEAVIDAVRHAVTVYGGGLTGDDIAMLAIAPT